MQIEFPYGKDSVLAEVPDKNILAVAKRKEQKVVKDERGEFLRSIQNPINSPTLNELTKDSAKILILTTNWARKMPNKALVPLLEELEKIGVNDASITLISANGFNRKNTEEEKKILVGDERILDRYTFVEHDPDDESMLTNNGKKTKYGTEVILNKLVWDADLIISTNRIDYHGMTGFMGGRKGLLPGIAGKNTIMSNHKLVFQTGWGPGLLSGNPFHEDMSELVDLADLPLFSIDTVYTKDQRVVQSFAGNIHKAFLEATSYYDQTCRFKVDELADIGLVGTGGYPTDSNMRHVPASWQKLQLKDDAVIISLAKCNEKFGELDFYDFIKKYDSIDEAWNALKENFPLGGWNIATFLTVLKNHEVILVSDMHDSMVKDAFMTPAKSTEEALEIAFNKKDKDAKILVMPLNDCLCTK